jgi:hypothetical protein
MQAAAPILSIASIGFGGAGDVAKGKVVQSQAEAGASQSDYDAQRSERAAEFGRINADEVDAQFREALNTTLTSIDAIRASSGIDPTSPTGLAIKENETRISDRDRLNKITSIRLQAEEDERSAKYSRSLAEYQRAVGKSALGLSYLNATGTAFKGLSSLASSYGGGGGGRTAIDLMPTDI